MGKVVTRYGQTLDLSVEGHVACPRCRKAGKDKAGDNFMVYGLDSEGKTLGGYCWSCDYTIPSEAYLEDNETETVEEDYDIMGSEFNPQVREKIKQSTGTDPKGYRSISHAVSKAFNIRYQYNEEDGSVEKVFYPCTEGFLLTGYKVRIDPKDFSSPIGDVGKACDLFGQFKFKNSSGKYVLITCGEHDQLAAYQMLTDYRNSRGQGDYEPIPVVSSTIGEAGSYKQFQRHYEWFNGFDQIIYCADNDEAGRKAVEKISKVLPKHKLYVMTLNSVKDPNQALQEGKSKEFISNFYKARAFVPSGIVGSAELLDKMKEAAIVPKIPLPPFMHKLQGLMAGGIPLKKIVCLGSASGTGKSTIIDEMVYYWLFNSPHKVGILSLESDSAEYGTKLLSRHMSNKIDLIADAQDKLDYLNSPDVDKKAEELFRVEDGSHRFHIIEERDGTLDSVKDLVMNLIIECDARVIIIDPLQDLLDGTSNEEQSSFMKWLKGMVKSHDASFILVNHVRKSGGGQKANSIGAEIHEEDFQGSSSIFKSSACNLLFTRNKEHENDILRNVTKMKCTKLRWTGMTSGSAGEYYYDNQTHTLSDLHDYLDKNPQARVLYDEGVVDNGF